MPDTVPSTLAKGGTCYYSSKCGNRLREADVLIYHQAAYKWQDLDSNPGLSDSPGKKDSAVFLRFMVNF